MPPQLAALLCILLILYLFVADVRKKREGVSGAIWVPLLWMFFAGSRYASQWLETGNSVQSVYEYAEGSPLDAAVFFALIVVGILVIARRNVAWHRFVSENRWILLFMAYCLISVSWSDDPFISVKRWIKLLGNLVMAVLILTETLPFKALGVIFKRLSYVFLPLSILFILYYPDMGRTYHMGAPMYTGVAYQKNSLGQICLYLGIYYCWEAIFDRNGEFSSHGKLSFVISLLMMLMILWLLRMANSATALVCLTIAVCLLAVCRLPSMAQRPAKIPFLVIGSGVIVILAQWILDLKSYLLALLNRDADLTMRTTVWNDLLSRVENPILGVGYEMYWSGQRLARSINEMTGIVQAHNGYLETYLNIGAVGLFILIACIVSGLIKISKSFDDNYAQTVLRLSFAVPIIVYNWTEATFKPVSNTFVILLLCMIDISRRE